jgi:hypothetical protein
MQRVAQESYGGKVLKQFRAMCLGYNSRGDMCAADIFFFRRHLSPGVIAHETFHAVCCLARIKKFRAVIGAHGVTAIRKEEWICRRLHRVVDQIHVGLKQAKLLP